MKLRKQRVLLYTIVGAICCYCLYKFQQTKPKRMNIHELDDEFWPVGLRKPTSLKPLRPIPLIIPQIHVKNFTSLVVSSDMTDTVAEDAFYRYLENKDVKCKNDQRLGSMHDGGWNVCLSPPMGFKQPCLVYSFGIGDDWRFDSVAAKIYGCTVMAFDPSINIPDHYASDLIHFKQIGLAPRNYVSPGGWKMKTLSQILKDEGHQETLINYVKFDIEYSEWKVIESILKEGSLRNVKQLGFEMHTRELFKVSRIDMPTGTTDFVRMYRTLRNLELHNFKKFNYRKNPFGEYKSKHSGKIRSCCYELHYINMNLLLPNETIVHHKDSPLFH